MAQELVGEGSPVGGHRIDARDGAQRHGVGEGTLVSHHPHGLVQQKDCSRLPDLVVQPPFAKAADEDVIRFLESPDLFGCDLAHDADGQARPREGMAADQRLRDPQTPADPAHLILE